MSQPLFSAIDALVPFVVLIVIGFLIRSVVNGDFRVDPNHRYAEYQVNAYIVETDYILWSGQTVKEYGHADCVRKYVDTHTDRSITFELVEENVKQECRYC